MGRIGGPPVGCRAEGLSAARAERAGPFSRLGCVNSESFKLFFYFPEAFLIVFLNEFVYSLISIQFYTKVYII